MSYKNNRLIESFDLKKRLEVAGVIMDFLSSILLS
jgi:hypothetical protein